MKNLITILLISFIGISVAQTNPNSTPIHTKKTAHAKNKKLAKKKTQITSKKTITKKHSAKTTRKHHPHQYRHTTRSIVKNTYNSPQTIPKDFIDSEAIKHQPRLYSYSAVALNAKTGEIFVNKNSDVKLPIASITKLMTAMVLLDSGVDLNGYVTISTDDIDTLKDTYSRLKVGLQFRRKDLLLLALMSSENRAAHALARTTFKGGLSVFVRKMNEKAKSLGMFHTQFYDPTGLISKNQSTAMDLSKMIQAAYSYDEIRKDTTSKDAQVMFSSRYVHTYINSDALVRGGNKLQIEVSKTGFTNEAGHCLALYTIINNTHVVMVFLNSASKSGRLLDAMTIKNYVLENK